jgi:CBS domain containing-hemolysin-like protein
LVEDAFECLDLPYHELEESTMGGYVFNLLGREPKVNDRVEDDYCIYEVLEVDNMRINSVKVTVKERFEDVEID